MQVATVMYGQKAGDQSDPAVPMPIFRMTEWIIQTAAVIMRSFSISEVTLELVQSGLIPVSNVRFKESGDDESLPQELKDIRVEILRSLLRPMFERFGLGTIRLTLTESEQDEVRQYWQFLRTGLTPDGSAQPANAQSEGEIKFENIELQYETDPNPIVTEIAVPLEDNGSGDTDEPGAASESGGGSGGAPAS